MRQSLLVPHLKIRLIADAPYNIASDRSYCQLSTVNCQSHPKHRLSFKCRCISAFRGS
ncbi:hypothetical protein [Microcoleus sp. CAWBG58]|uniref:hypothetical protein n=1 Tax=Microcoleus sp. CAWBG58 TaxID=2841651 RepID=UPI0025E664A1|nr:hypothetical protein [Microcoleus sp. CAWBG58]